MEIFTTTIGDILAGFEKTIDALDKLVARNGAKVTVHAGRIADMMDKNTALATESNKARIVSKKLQELIAD